MAESLDVKTEQVDDIPVLLPVQEAERRLSWRVYATNQPQDILLLDQAIPAYREEYLVERSFGRLKGKSMSLSPMYLHSDERATGLIHLLSIGLRILTLIEYQARQRLADLNEKNCLACKPEIRNGPRPHRRSNASGFI